MKHRLPSLHFPFPSSQQASSDSRSAFVPEALSHLLIILCLRWFSRKRSAAVPGRRRPSEARNRPKIVRIRCFGIKSQGLVKFSFGFLRQSLPLIGPTHQHSRPSEITDLGKKLRKGF